MDAKKANVVAYSDIASKKITGLDSTEDAQEFFNSRQRKIQFSLGTHHEDHNIKAVFDVWLFWFFFVKTIYSLA